MNCHEAAKSLREFLSGELSREDAETIRTHLADCQDCRLRLDPVDRVEVIPAIDEVVELSPDIGARFHARLDAHRRQARLSAPPDRWQILQRLCTTKRLATAAMAATLVLGAVLVAGRLWRPDEPEVGGRDLAIAENLPLLKDMDVISKLELLENFEEIQAAALDSGTGR